MVTLLLHQQSVPDALGQFRTHVGWLRHPPATPARPPAAAAAHALWLQRQYAVMGELLATRVDAGVLPDQARRRPAELQPAAVVMRTGSTCAGRSASPKGARHCMKAVLVLGGTRFMG